MSTSECTNCGYDPSACRASVRKQLAVCDGCGTLCEDCLVKVAVEHGGMSEADARQIVEIHGAYGLLNRCEETGDSLCAECFEKEN